MAVRWRPSVGAIGHSREQGPVAPSSSTDPYRDDDDDRASRPLILNPEYAQSRCSAQHPERTTSVIGPAHAAVVRCPAHAAFCVNLGILLSGGGHQSVPNRSGSPASTSTRISLAGEVNNSRLRRCKSMDCSFFSISQNTRSQPVVSLRPRCQRQQLRPFNQTPSEPGGLVTRLCRAHPSYA